MDWKSHARRLADGIVRTDSRWHDPLSQTPRHLFVPRWWERTKEGRVVCDGAADTETWLRAAYRDDTLVTRLGPLHADDTAAGTVAQGRPTSSSTLPTLVVMMYRNAAITYDSDVLVTTGSGYGTALLSRWLPEAQVTSVDVDPYLVEVAQERLKLINLAPDMAVCDLTGELPDRYDRIVSTVSVPSVPVSWLTALKPGGRLVTTLAGTGLIVVADKTKDGGAAGYVAEGKAAFMAARHGDDYDDAPEDAGLWETAQHADGESVTTGRYPLTYVPDTWDVRSTLELLAPGIDHRQHTGDDRQRTVYMLHADGSWARATSPSARELPTVHQGGPRRLWDELDRIRTWLVMDGDLPVSGAAVRVDPDGAVTFSRRGWSATIPA
ncbi:methyltransferase type 11 [Streptomyces violascens]|uniref:methyltransferase type 11 n=1 Tax=Streptomyces violascens TaxID=67381 RepID=UPI0016749BA0|nr:methyltransferase type 11 [Streptomyces violascens]GGU49922.1 protein-L-isoaspartate O-methyltransferase [Streptomyces violascens]